MPTYARINSLTLKADNVIVAEESFIKERSDYDLWIKTSVALTKKSAGPGDTYTVATNSFKGDSPYASWVFDESSWSWEPPTAMPNQTGIEVYDWNEATTSWVEVE
tara:strand:- start:50 stop:367 length:318 start_codon:yes stop_codon:yes gene_type:complete